MKVLVGALAGMWQGMGELSRNEEERGAEERGAEEGKEHCPDRRSQRAGAAANPLNPRLKVTCG